MHQRILQNYTENAIAAEKERLLVTLQSIGYGVITTDEKGNIILMNNVAEELTGWLNNEVYNQPVFDIFNIIDKRSRKNEKMLIKKVLTEGLTFTRADDLILINRKREEKLIMYTCTPIKDSFDKIIGIVLVFHDITEKQKIKETLYNTQKLESIGILAGGIAHDFNNLLGGIFGYIELAKENAVEYDYKNVILNLNKSLEVYNKAKDLTQKLLTFSQGGTPVKKIQSIIPVIKKAVDHVLNGTDIIAIYDLNDKLWLSDIDFNQFSQVISHIVLNALQAKPFDHLVKISAVNFVTSYQQGILQQNENYICITIQDKGYGIRKDHLHRIFDPFFTTKQHGSGLGLAISYSIIKKHDGHIEVESEIGQGTTVKIFLPAVIQESTSLIQRQQFIADESGHILIIDDEQYLRDLVNKMLIMMGYTVKTAANGNEAYDIYKNAFHSSVPIDLVICDLTIPGGSGGKEIIKELLTVNPKLKAIATSGYSDDPVMSNPENFGFKGKLIKPFRFNELSEIVKSVIKKG